MFLFEWVRISLEFDWYHFRGASPSPNNDKDLYEVKCHIRAQCAPPPLDVFDIFPQENKALGIIDRGGVMKAIIFPLFIFYLPLTSFIFEISYFILMS